jgi:hypothetical protein
MARTKKSAGETHSLVVSDDVIKKVDDLIATVGAEEAIRLIEVRKAKGKAGRPVGLKYQKLDQQLLMLAGALQIEWERRLPQVSAPQHNTRY